MRSRVLVFRRKLGLLLLVLSEREPKTLRTKPDKSQGTIRQDPKNCTNDRIPEPIKTKYIHLRFLHLAPKWRELESIPVASVLSTTLSKWRNPAIPLIGITGFPLNALRGQGP